MSIKRQLGLTAVAAVTAVASFWLGYQRGAINQQPARGPGPVFCEIKKQDQFWYRPDEHNAASWNRMLAEMACTTRDRDVKAPVFENTGVKVGDHILCNADNIWSKRETWPPGVKTFRMEPGDLPPDSVIPHGADTYLRIMAKPGCPVGYVIEQEYGVPIGFEYGCRSLPPAEPSSDSSPSTETPALILPHYEQKEISASY